MRRPEQAAGDPLPRGRRRKEPAKAVSACWPVSGLTWTRVTFPEADPPVACAPKLMPHRGGIARRTVAGAAQFRFASADACLLLPV